MANDVIPPVVLASGGLIAVERNAGQMQRAVREAAKVGGLFVVPAPVVAQVWRGGARQAPLARFLRLPFVEIDLLSTALWRAAGELCGHSGSSDVVDAAVVICARRRGARIVVTSDAGDLRRLEPALDYRSP